MTFFATHRTPQSGVFRSLDQVEERLNSHLAEMDVVIRTSESLAATMSVHTEAVRRLRAEIGRTLSTLPKDVTDECST